jgi:cell division protein FtsW (lipid II flippase)
MRVSRETGIVGVLCALDLLSTLVLIQHHGADEGNTLMSFYLKQGTWAFIGAKCLLFVPALMIAEWYRRRNPRLVSVTLRAVIVTYVVFYAAGVVQGNRPVTATELDWDQDPPGTGAAALLPGSPAHALVGLSGR